MADLHATSPTALLRRLARALDGPRPVLPRPVDRLSEWWAARPPRLRLVLTCAAAGLALLGAEARVRAAERRWGGPPRAVLVADADLGAGDLPHPLRRVLVPPALAPPGAVERVDASTPLALALPAGTVLTRRHLDPAGPAAGLADGLRAVPVPVDEGWGVTPGGRVDVWVLDEHGQARLIARARPVVDVRGEAPATALVGLAEDETEQATRGLAGSRLLLTHAPP